MSTDHSSSADDASQASHKKTSVLDSLKSAGGSFKRFVTHSSLKEGQKDDLNQALHNGGEKKAELERYRDLKAGFEKMKKVDAAYAANQALAPLSGRKGLDSTETNRQLKLLETMENEIKAMEKKNPLIKKELEYAQRHGEVDKVKKDAAGQGTSLRDTLKGAVGVKTDPRQSSSRQQRL
ncbi:hypothetical protein [Prosthecobacter dejongeii]|uniref:Uncharacterized protein n=1 Tax=Prosthecobacter dejongeii TaxID=48465 RepID=A0A7W7YLX5_9BACT|nr:hypothetical protein [Prosthecobacter dejongeii]MBB5038397.1 hypothetical protein [Prosthecobacter dejongeii]